MDNKPTMEILLILAAIATYFTLSYNFPWFLVVVAFNLIVGKSLIIKLFLVAMATYYIYDAVDYYSDALHRAPLTFDLLKARSQ